MSEPGSRTVKDSVDQGHYAVQRIKPTPLVKREDLEDFLESSLITYAHAGRKEKVVSLHTKSYR